MSVSGLLPLPTVGRLSFPEITHAADKLVMLTMIISYIVAKICVKTLRLIQHYCVISLENMIFNVKLYLGYGQQANLR